MGLKLSQGKRTVAVVACIVIAASCAYALRTSNHPLAREIRARVKQVLFSPHDRLTNETEGLYGVKGVEYYQDNRLVPASSLDRSRDVKAIYHAEGKQRLINYPDGYLVDVPEDYAFDFRYSPLYTRMYNRTSEVIITREWSQYPDVDGYIDYYLLRFVLNPQWRAANGVTLVEEKTLRYGNYTVKLVSLVLGGLEGRQDKFDGYTIVTLHGSKQWFFRFLIKHRSTDERMSAIVEEMLSSFRAFYPSGNPAFDVSFAPVIPETWSSETQDVYKSICASTGVKWGIFVEDIFQEGITSTIPALEAKLDYAFDVVLCYLHFGADFPTEFMEKNYEAGKLVELTYQTSYQGLYDYTPALDIYRGKKDDELRKFARAAREFGHPFLFRLNNEMNSDWTDYSGVVNLCDPEIYIEIWRRVYTIFAEEGVNNAIWVFNPNDMDFPPCRWNNFLAYYPGDEYVHMIGVTGYNTGTYYKDVTGERWREFEEIYDNIAANYRPLFGKFPWIITEFASSSVGGDKAEWIRRMFRKLPDYPEIKIAVWFSAADYDVRPGFEGRVSRPYWLDETPETVEAFRNGLKDLKRRAPASPLPEFKILRDSGE
ncbi:MAG TPA: hypothetical protein GX510_05725 [Firmicutes bacterium]|nr:hypothetical protein [Candidatus Fermentithermobacillaceae bacterium]